MPRNPILNWAQRVGDNLKARRWRAISAVVAERDALRERCVVLEAEVASYGASGFPPGHFYSPIADINDPHVLAAVGPTRALPAGVELDQKKILEWMRRLAVHQPRFPFPMTKGEPYRYYRDNPAFRSGDAVVLFGMLLECQPKRVIEVGCGFSSCVLLDTNEEFFDGAMQLTLIDPYLDSVMDWFGPKGAAGVRLMPLKLQDVPPEVFDELEAGDILFLDSSHVSKAGSDVNHYMFRILPRLRSGVVVHIHDIGYPCEYPRDWVIGLQRNWNEAYLLAAFLQFNRDFEILYWVHFAEERLPAEMAEMIPLGVGQSGGSIWLRRV